MTRGTGAAIVRAARRVAPLLQVLAGAGILVALLARLGAGAVLDGLRAIGPWSVLAALGIGLLSTVCGAGRWCLVARGLGLPLTLPVAVADCYRAMFLNSVLPAGVLGDVHRAVDHGRRAGDLGRGLRAVVLERVAGNAVLVVVAVGVLLAEPALLTAALGGPPPGSGLAVGSAVGAVAVVALGYGTLRRPGASRIRAALRTGLADVRAGVLTRGTGPGVVLLSAAALTGHLALFVVAARVAGVQAALGELLPLLVLALLAMALPLGAGGWGPREAVAAGAFVVAGLGAAQGLAAAVVFGALALVSCLPGLGVLLLRRPRPARGRASSVHAVPAPAGAAERSAR